MGRFIGERRALAAAVLGFYTFLFTLVAMSPPPGWGACFAALAGVYGAGFFGVVAGYFWARWYAIGVGLSGLITGIISVYQVGMEPVLMFYGLTHGAAALILWGDGVATAFDGRKEWRERFHLDESATHRLGKAVIRLGVSLPYVIMYALAPRDGAAAELLAATAALLVGVGLFAVLKMRTWGLAALAAGAATIVWSLVTGAVHTVALRGGYHVDLGAMAMAGAIFVIAALVPFARPIARYLRA